MSPDSKMDDLEVLTQDERVSFTPAQQDKLNQILARNTARLKERAKEQLASRDAQLTELRKQNLLRKTLVDLDLFIDVDDVAELAGESIRLDANGKLSAVGRAGTMEEFFRDFATQKPYLVKAPISDAPPPKSTDSKPGRPGQTPLEKLFGKKSDSKLANEFALKNPSEYRRLRAEAIKQNLIG